MLHRNPQKHYNTKHHSHPTLITNPIHNHNLNHLNFTSLLQSFNLFSEIPNGHRHNQNGRQLRLQLFHHSTPLQHPQGVPFLQLHSLGCSLQLHLPHPLPAPHSLSMRLLLHPSSGLHDCGCSLGLCCCGG